MGFNKLFGTMLVILMVDLNLAADQKGYPRLPAYVRNITEDAVPMPRDLHYTTILNIALFPFLPDLDNDNHRNLLGYIKDEFEKLYPSVHIIFRPMNVNDEFYDVPQVIDWLDGPAGVYDIVEIDTVILGDLVDAGVVAPQYISSRYPPADWHPAALGGVTVNGEIYAYPHLLCAILLFTRDNGIASAVTIDDFIRAANAAKPKYAYNIVGNLNSSWDVTALYLDSYRETHPPYTQLYGSFDYWDAPDLPNLRRIAQLCALYPNINHCLDGTFSDKYDEPARIFATKQAHGMYGYSERLHQIFKEGMAAGISDLTVKIIPMPLGDIPNEPLFYTDAFVFRRGMSFDKLAAAQNFVEFMATPKMQAAVAAAEETAKNKVPLRYLLPMSSKAYDVPFLSTDPYYQLYFRKLTGRNLPNRGMNKLRNNGKEWLSGYLSRPF
jgi:thiamine pyridinylase